MIRVIVTDDSAFMRKLLSDLINSDPELEVIATAKDGQELLDKLATHKPDLITLDISMPVMDGITALKKIMEERPLPVIMISSLADEENTFACLELGAVDFIPKTSGIISIDMNKKKEAIIKKIKAAATAKLDTSITPQNLEDIDAKQLGDRYMVCIGASTGGPKTIESILQAIPKEFPAPIVIVQHMPEEYTLAYAQRLNKSCEIEVKEAEDKEEIRPGTAYVTPGGHHLEIKNDKGVFRFSIVRDIDSKEIVPNINITMKSIAHAYKSHAIGIILTGMGEDGAEGMKEIKKKNGKTIVQDEKTCVVSGMPKATIKAGAVDKIVPLSGIAQEIMRLM